MHTLSRRRAAARRTGPSHRRSYLPMLSLSAVTAALLLVLLPPAAASQAAAQPTPSTGTQQEREVKAVVVRGPEENGGVPDSLAQIAQRTLGDPGRAVEIFELNRGRVQADGTALQTPAAILPGWVLELPPDATGPDVRQGVVSDAGGATAPPGPGPTAGADPNATGAAQNAGDGTQSIFARRILGLRLPILLAVTGGVLLAVVSAILLLRQQISGGIGRVRRTLRRLHDRLTAGRRRRQALQRRATLAQAWRRDGASTFAARATFGAVGRVIGADALGPVALHLTGDRAVVLGVANADLPEPWVRAEKDAAWSRPATSLSRESPELGTARPVRVGGREDEQLYVDLNHCLGALSVVGDVRIGTEAVRALVAQITATYPDVRVLTWGPSLELAGATPVGSAAELDRWWPPVPHGRPIPRPLRALAPARPLQGVVVVPADRLATDGAEVVERCTAADSGWLAICMGEVPGAHWRWHFRPDGLLHIPMLETTVVAVA